MRWEELAFEIEICEQKHSKRKENYFNCNLLDEKWHL